MIESVCHSVPDELGRKTVCLRFYLQVYDLQITGKSYRTYWNLLKVWYNYLPNSHTTTTTTLNIDMNILNVKTVFKTETLQNVMQNNTANTLFPEKPKT